MNPPVPPDYLDGKTAIPDTSGPAKHLASGEWCGHGEPLFSVFDIQSHDAKVFRVFLSVCEGDEFTMPAVGVSSVVSEDSFLIYDPRRHPANGFFGKAEEPLFDESFFCPDCGEDNFNVAVGFEIPKDSSGPNDTSWFVLAAQCCKCGWSDVVVDDETA